jgi:Transglutaminase-like superfamily
MRALTLQVFVELIRHDLFLTRHDFAALHNKVHLLPLAQRQPQPGDIEKICQAVAYACIWYYKPVLCLQRSAVATTLLRRYGIHAEMVIGAQRLPLKAHAWVEVDGKVVNDKPEVQTNYLVMERC